MMHKKSMLKLYKQKGIQIFIARIVEKEPLAENMNEIIEAIKFIRNWILMDAMSFPKLLGNSIVSLAEQKSDE